MVIILVQCNSLPGNSGSWHPCGYYFDTHLNCIADQVHPLMVTPLSNIRNNVPCHTINTIQEWFDEHNKEPKALTKLQTLLIQIHSGIRGTPRNSDPTHLASQDPPKKTKQPKHLLPMCQCQVPQVNLRGPLSQQVRVVYSNMRGTKALLGKWF